MENSFSVLSSIIKERRSTKPAQLNGSVIPDEQVEKLLELADWAPNHGNTEPWRFIVYAGAAAKSFCKDHADLYKRMIPAENFMQGSYDKIIENGNHASHIIVAVMQRGKLPKIPLWEEEAATAAAMQNILLGATALGIASFWSTGGMVHNPAMKDFLQLNEHDRVMGILFLGYSDAENKGKRTIPLTDKVKWVS
ncbi:nitroreductase [Ferruginibacter albus]|nr:nitroreductase [Ferruginibacter albus]